MKTLACTKITKKQFNELIMDLRGKIFVLGINIEALIEKNGKIYEDGFAALKETRYNLGIVSLYLHALEQLGKLIMIKDCENTFDGMYYDLDSIKTDFYIHDKKIDKALGVLSNNCKDIFSEQTQSNVNLDLRLKLLHSDIDKNGNVVIADSVDPQKIKKAFEIFKTQQYSY